MPFLVFSFRLQGLMENEKVSKRKLSLATGIDRKAIKTYVQGVCLPRYDALARLADYFEVSADYLLGLEEEDSLCYKTICKTEEIPALFVYRVKELMKENSLSQNKLAKQLRMKQPTISKWLNGKTMPETFSLMDLAATFSCKVDYLIGRELRSSM